MSAPLFIASAHALAAGPGCRVTLDGTEGRHAVSVRRMAPGEALRLSDGAGMLADAVVLEVTGRDRLVAELLTLERVPAPQPRVVVVQALPKGDRGQLAVELLTEVGADVIVPWAATRCVARWEGAKAEAGRVKWQATAREAGKQARRPWIPEVRRLAMTWEVASLLAQATCAVVLHEAVGGVPLGSVGIPGVGDVVLVVGPEGGITAEELSQFVGAGATHALLGPSVMRTSTAGAVAVGLVLSGSPRWR